MPGGVCASPGPVCLRVCPFGRLVGDGSMLATPICMNTPQIDDIAEVGPRQPKYIMAKVL